MSLLYVVPFLFLRWLTATSAMVTEKSLTTDEQALLAFKAQVSDPGNFLATNWSVSYPVCSWVGVTCSARHNRVSALNLSSMGLQGTIPPHLGNLSFLVDLDVSFNSFHGGLPDELGQLSRIMLLEFSDNQFSGSNLASSVPNSLFNLSELVVLDLSNNHFRGEIPDDICSRLSNLEDLYLDSNKFSGRVPSSLGDCTFLQDLWLSHNNFTGRLPQGLGNLTELEYLILSENKLQGEIPAGIFNISTLLVVDVGGNQLTGQLPSTFGHGLPKLESLYLGGNGFSGSIPNSITNASQLTEVDFFSNSFSGLIPNSFGNLRFLTLLSLGVNSLTTKSSATGEWSFLSSLTNCRHLTVLSLEFNPLGGILPPLIGNLSTSLQRLYAYHCRIMGNIPQEISNLHNLIDLAVNENGLSGVIPRTVGRLHKLQGLSLQRNNLEGTIPQEICDLKGLNLLYLFENKLSGQIPQCFATIRSLRQLDLSSNKLTSYIPSSLWSLQDVSVIDLSSNSLRGSLPESIGSLKAMTELDLSRNQLLGDIPISIGGLSALLTLSLAGNHFQGSIPESFGSMTSLEFLDLSSNSLIGEIPKSLEALSYLKQFNVSHNRLKGEIPTQGPFRNFSVQSFVWNYALCGPTRLQVPPCKKDYKNDSKKDAMPMLVLKYVLPPIIFIGLIATIIIVIIRRRARNARTQRQEDLAPLATWRRVSYIDLKRATNGFHDCNLLGAGSYGKVYKGTLSDGTNVAVKVFNLQLEKASASFDSECEVLQNVRHRNLIEIISSCCTADFAALVLEFIPNGSLDKWLYSYNYFLDILQRLDIMIDVALALEYLHHGHSASAAVVHCDLKPSNILIDEDMVAHVSDFGISKLLGEGDDSVTQTMTIATIGYMAPEYGSEGIVSAKCDVYSFGVLLMETFTRKKPTDEQFSGEMNLKNWVWKSLPQALTEVVDENLILEDENFPMKMDCLSSIMHLALDYCCIESPEQRICMTDAAARLKKIKVTFLDDVAAANK